PLSDMDARQSLGQTLCDTAALDMTKYWTASIDSYFDHIRKDAIIEALIEVNPKLERSALDNAPKKEVLARAKKAFRTRSWLPLPLRTLTEGQPAVAIAAE